MDDIIIFTARQVDELIAYEFFNQNNITAFAEQLSHEDPNFKPTMQFAIDVKKKVIVATNNSGNRRWANFINLKYFEELGAEVIPCKGSIVHENKLELCRYENEIFWFRNEMPDDVKFKFGMPLPPYDFNWGRFPKMGDRRSKVILLLLGYELAKINEPIDG